VQLLLSLLVFEDKNDGYICVSLKLSAPPPPRPSHDDLALLIISFHP